MQQLARRVPWLLFSDIHFRHHDLDRIQKTAQWITALTRQRHVRRVVICGDLLTSRSTQPTQVLSACYRFLHELSDAGPHINIILGNHDLAYKHDYQTTALEALRARRLSPYVTVHSDVATAEWDGRRVLLLPFREDQTELVDAVAALDADTARQTVAFAHLAINGAITQRHLVGSAHSITYRGLTGPDRFASLARTFTGHFHSHQTIVQPTREMTGQSVDPLNGSIIYLGSPHQMTWGDLDDEQRGVILLDPDTLQHELVVSPCGIAYTTVNTGHVLRGETALDSVQGMHVMLSGDITRFTYVTARDRLLAHGARSVRSWNPLGPVLREQPYARGGLGATIVSGDVGVEGAVAATPVESAPPLDPPGVQRTATTPSDLAMPAPQLDLAAEARKYVFLLDLESLLLARRDALIDVGQRLLRIAGQMKDGSDDRDNSISYGNLFDDATEKTNVHGESRGGPWRLKPAQQPTARVFVAKPRSLTITNFMGINGRLRLEFGPDLPRGLVFLSGENGSGKSTIIEAMTWCQFGRCIRSGMAAEDMINDAAGRDCSVELAFDNGYTIKRCRKDRTYGNRVLVSLHGILQTDFDHAGSHLTQAAIDELLGIDYDTYVRTVVLGHESTASFLNASAVQRRDLIESALKLSVLDQCSTMARDLLKHMDADLVQVRANLRAVEERRSDAQGRLRQLQEIQTRLIRELEHVTMVAAVTRKELGIQGDCAKEAEEAPDTLSLGAKYSELLSHISALDAQIVTVRHKENEMLALVRLADAYSTFRDRKAHLLSQLLDSGQRLGRLPSSRANIHGQNMDAGSAADPSWSLRLVTKSRDVLGRIESRLSAYSLTWGIKTVLEPIIAALNRLEQRLHSMESPTGGGAERSRENRQDLVNYIERDIEVTTKYISRLREWVDKERLVQSIALDYKVQQADLDSAIEDQAAQRLDREALGREHAELQRTRKELQQRDGELRRQSEEWMRRARDYERARQQMAGKQQGLSTYTHLIQAEEGTVASLGAQSLKIGVQITELESSRELLAFWTATLAKKTHRTTAAATDNKSGKSGKSSKGKGKGGGRITFREYLLDKCLDELNGLMAEVLTVLYDDTRHVRTMASGMLRSLLADGDARLPLLDRTLRVGGGGGARGLAYGKRSSGERKRMDLALFFALVQLGQAHSPHRAHYLLVDEALDSLDAAGQAAVVRWCGSMEARVEFVLAVTHSPFLVQDGELGESAGSTGSAMSIMTARVGSRGTELLVDGRLVGRDPEA